jgi:hypothetical protein
MRRPRLEVLAFLVAVALFAMAVRTLHERRRVPPPDWLRSGSTTLYGNGATIEVPSQWLEAELAAVVEAGYGLWVRLADGEACVCKHAPLDMVENLSDPEGLCVPETCECAPARVRGGI